MKRISIFIILFLISTFTIYTVLNMIKENSIGEYLKSKTNKYEQNYKALYHQYKTLANVIFKTEINKEDVLNIFKNAKTASSEERNIIRNKLYDKLKNTYTLLEENNLDQLHFHLPNNDSFLRFHKINKYGDNLSDIRKTVKQVNSSKKNIDGFEIGRLHSGYRFVFPVFLEKDYLGSVETSFSPNAMSSEFIEHYGVYAEVLFFKEIIDKKVFKLEKLKYIDSMFKDFYKRKVNVNNKVEVTQKTKNMFNNKWREKEPFSLYDENTNEVMTFIKINNPLTNEIVSVLLLQSDAKYIINTSRKYQALFITLSMFIALILFFIFKEFNYRVLIELNNKKLTSIIMGADTGIALMDLDGNFLEVNEAYSNILGYSKDELLHLSCLDLSTPLTKEQSKKGIKEAFEKGSISKRRKHCIRKDAQEIELEFSLTLLPSKDAFIAVVNSIEQRLALESLNKILESRVNIEVQANRKKDKKLLEQSRLAQMGEMLSMIAHQWRQPLGAISASIIGIQTKLYSKKYDLDDKNQREDFLKFMNKKHENINDYIAFLSETIDDFRTFFKPDKQKELISLISPIDRALYIIKSSLKSKNITVIKNYKCEEQVSMYKNEIMQVILNILKNSEDNFLERKTKNPTINIYTYVENNNCIIKINDNGGGISSNLLEKIYDPYFSTKNEKNGTGLGLYMSKTIVEDHNLGSLSAYNEDFGVSFKISLPRSKNV